MNVARAIDLEDTEGLIAADRGALLRAASMAGAQVRGFDDFPAAATGAPTGGGVLAPPEPGAGRRRGHLRVLPDPAD